MKMFALRWLQFGLVLGVIVVVGLLYWPSLENGLVWDDYYYLYDRAGYSVPELWWQTLSSNFALSINYFRPFVVGTFLFDVHVLGGGDRVFHQTNVVLFAVVCVVVFFLVYKLLVSLLDTPLALLCSFIVAVLVGCSPVLSEVVLWVSGRFDLMLSLFLVLTLLADVGLKGWWRIAGVGIAYLCAACSKEMAVAFGVVFPVWHLYLEALKPHKLNWFEVLLKRKNIEVYCSVIVAGVVYILLRYLALDGLYHSVGASESSPAVGAENIYLVLKTIGGYGLLALGFAQNLSPVYPLVFPIELGDPLVIVGLCILLVCAVLIVRKHVLGIVLLAFLLSLLPVIHLAPLNISGNFMHQRFLVFPYLLLVIMLTPLLCRFFLRMNAGVGLLVVAVVMSILGAVVVRSVIPMWSSNQVLWTWVNQRYPDYPMASVNLVVDASGRGDFSGAIELGERLLENGEIPFKHRVFIHGALGNSYFRVGEHDKMKRQYESIFQSYGVNDLKLYHYSRIYSAFARSLIVIEPNSESLDGILKMAISLDKYNHMALFLSGIVSFRNGMQSEGWEKITRAMRYMDPARQKEAIIFVNALDVGAEIKEQGYDFQELVR